MEEILSEYSKKVSADKNYTIFAEDLYSALVYYITKKSCEHINVQIEAFNTQMKTKYHFVADKANSSHPNIVTIVVHDTPANVDLGLLGLNNSLFELLARFSHCFFIEETFRSVTCKNQQLIEKNAIHFLNSQLHNPESFKYINLCCKGSNPLLSALNEK